MTKEGRPCFSSDSDQPLLAMNTAIRGLAELPINFMTDVNNTVEVSHSSHILVDSKNLGRPRGSSDTGCCPCRHGNVCCHCFPGLCFHARDRSRRLRHALASLALVELGHIATDMVPCTVLLIAGGSTALAARYLRRGTPTAVGCIVAA